MIDNICVFASSCDFLDESYYKEAEKLGKLLAINNMNMNYFDFAQITSIE